MSRAKLISLDDSTWIELDVVISESVKNTAKVTTSPIEDGRNISDHMTVDPVSMSMSGVVVGIEAEQKRQTLKRWRDDRHRLQYIGRSTLFGYVITGFDETYDAQIGDGFKFSITLQEIKVVKPLINTIVEPDPAPINPVNTENPAATYAVQSQLSVETDLGRVGTVKLPVPFSIEREGKILTAYEVIMIDKNRVPYQMTLKIGGETCIIGFEYNGTGDYFVGYAYIPEVEGKKKKPVAGFEVTTGGGKLPTMTIPTSSEKRSKDTTVVGTKLVTNKPIIKVGDAGYLIVPMSISGIYHTLNWSLFGTFIRLYVCLQQEAN